MGQVITLARETVSREESYQRLVDQILVGLLWLDEGGGVIASNAPAKVLLSGPAEDRVRATVARLHAACVESPSLVQASVEVSLSERLHVSISPDRSPGTFLVVLDRQKLERARAEANVLRAVLKAIAHSVSRADASRRALEAVRSLVPFERLAFFELNVGGTHLLCTASDGAGDATLTGAAPIPIEPHDSLLSVAWAHQRLVHVRDLALAPGPALFGERAGLSAVLLPVGGRRPWGILYVSALPETLTEGALGLLQSLADALGAVQELASVEAEAARAREIAAQRDRLATIGQLVAGVAHELNNPLAFLKSNLNSLRGDLEDYKTQPTDELLRDMEEIVTESMQGVSRIEQLVQALKGTARSRNEKIRFEPSRAVSEAVTIFRGARKQECDIECRVAAMPEVMGAPSGLGQVVLNLMQNGLDAMAENERRDRKLEIVGRCDGQQVVFSFRDHGPGIPAAVQQRMYDAFYTTKDPGKGTGLGLYICHEIVESMGGRLEFTTCAQGTTFDVVLPLADEALPPRCSPP